MPSVSELADGLLGACLDFESEGPLVSQLEATVELLLESNSEEVYRAIEARADQVLDAFAKRAQANLYVVRLWLKAPASDWREWHARLREEAGAVPSEVLDPVLERIFDEFFALTQEQQTELPAQVRSLVSLRVSLGDKDEVPAFVAAAERALNSTAWWNSEPETAAQQRLHTVVHELRGLGSRAEQEGDGFLASDLIRGLEAAPGDDAVADAVIGLASPLPGSEVKRVAEELPTADFAGDPNAAACLLRVRGSLGRHLRTAGSELWEADPFVITGEEAEHAVQAELPAADRAVQDWFGLKPPRQDVARVLRAALARSSGLELRDALQTWAQEAARTDRTNLVRSLINWPQDTSGWIQAVAAAGVAEKGLIGQLSTKMEQAKNESDRLVIARKARALKPQGNAGQRQLADLVLWLLGHGRPKADIAVATTVVEGLGKEHQSSRRLARAFREATGRHGQNLKRDQAAALQAAGIEIPKESLGKKIRKLFFR